MEEMDKDMMRQGLLMELIDNMHGRLADKMFPPNPDAASEPAATGIPGSEAKADETMVEGESKTPGDYHGDTKADETGIPSEEMDDEELEELLKGVTND